MKWFKHFTDWRHDSDIRSAMSYFDHLGYVFYIQLKEIYGEHYNECDENGFLKFPKVVLMENLKIKKTKLRTLFEFYRQRNRLEYREEGEFIAFQIPEFMRLASRWEKRKESNNLKELTKNDMTEERRKEEIEKRRKEEEREKFFFNDSQEILNYLNKEAGKHFSDTTFVINLLRIGKKKEDFLKIIDNKIKDTFFQKNKKLYNPMTLFGVHFDIYLNENNEKENDSENDRLKSENLSSETISKIYERYLKIEHRAAQDEFNSILVNYDIDDDMQEMNLADIMENMTIAAIEDTIVIYIENGATERQKQFLEIVKNKTGKEYKVITKVPEEFMNTGMFNYFKNLIKMEAFAKGSTIREG